MKDFPKYKIAYPQVNADDFNELLKSGWELYGNPFIDQDGVICQALTF